MSAQTGAIAALPGARHQLSFVGRLAEALKRKLGIGWSERVADDLLVAPAAPPADGSADLPAHHARYSKAELEAMIEESIYTGKVDFQAVRETSSRREGDESGGSRRRSRSKSCPAAPVAAAQARTFGGDLYPTAAHRVGRHVRQVESGWPGAGPAK